MKRFQLFKLLPLVAVVFAAACSDSTTAPVTPPRALLVPDGPLFAGNPPPPPVDAAVVVCAGGICVVVAGVYNALDAAALFAFSAPSGTCTFPGIAWLKFKEGQQGNQEAEGEFEGERNEQGVEVKGNARIKCKDLVASGKGKIEFGPPGNRVVVMLAQVLTFDNQPDCLGRCAGFTANATVNGSPTVAVGEAFERSYFDANCKIVFGDGGPFVDCGSPPG